MRGSASRIAKWQRMAMSNSRICMTNKALEVANWQEAQRPIAGTCEVISQQRITNSKPSTSPPLYSPFTSCSQIVSGDLPNRIGERQTSSFKASTFNCGNKSGFWDSWANCSSWAFRRHTVPWHVLRVNFAACLYDRDENRKNQLLFLELKVSGSLN